jgi:hypothetical protein
VIFSSLLLEKKIVEIFEKYGKRLILEESRPACSSGIHHCIGIKKRHPTKATSMKSRGPKTGTESSKVKVMGLAGNLLAELEQDFVADCRCLREKNQLTWSSPSGSGPGEEEPI